MPSLNNLPVELVVKILEGASLKDILNVTRTSTFLRAVGCSSRSLWKNAQDVDRLPLPMGQTLETVSLWLISKLAAYAIALSAVWGGPVAHPRRVSHIGPCPSQPRSPGTLTSPHGTILPGNQWLLIDVDTDSPHLYCPANGEFFPLDVDGSVMCYAYESPTNGNSIVIAVLKRKWRGQPFESNYDKFIDVYILQFDPKRHCRSTPCVRRAQSIHLPAEKFVEKIALKGSLVVVSADEIFIFDWQQRSGVNLSHPMISDPEGEQIVDVILSLNAYFHPTLPLLMVEKRTPSGISILVVDVPAQLAPFEGSDLTDQNLNWPTGSFRSTSIYAPESLQDTCYRGSHRNGTESPVLDVIYRGPLQDLTYLSVSGLEGPTPETSCHHVGLRKQLLELRTTAGRHICLGRRTSYMESLLHGLHFLRMPRGYRKEPSWVKLEIPEDVTLRGTDSEVLAFDDVYGTLLLDDAVGNYCIVQY